MTFRKPLGDRAVMVRVGAASLLLANASHWFLHPAGAVWQGLTDGLTGTLFGVAIASLLLSLRSRPRPCLPGAD